MLVDHDRLTFRHKNGWKSASEIPVTADWSVRRFFRLNDGKRSAILMQSYPDHHPQSLVGHKIADYVRIAAYLRSHNIRVPDIYAVDDNLGCLLVEDFGDVSMHEALAPALYNKATDILAALSHLRTNDLNLKNYADTHLFTGKRRFVDWFLPAVLDRTVSDDEIDLFHAAWRDVEKQLMPLPSSFQHGDFHPHNVMVLTDGSLGLIDFQGALFAPLPYDLVNLLEDARRVVPDDIKLHSRSLFTKNLSASEKESFDAWYAVMSAQFHFRVIGQAYRLAIREGKTRLFAIVPTLQQHILADVKHPLLEPVRHAMQQMHINLAQAAQFDVARIARLIRADAF
jgi:N-acetylmuramate 1-kinase